MSTNLEEITVLIILNIVILSFGGMTAHGREILFETATGLSEKAVLELLLNNRGVCIPGIFKYINTSISK